MEVEGKTATVVKKIEEVTYDEDDDDFEEFELESNFYFFEKSNFRTLRFWVDFWHFIKSLKANQFRMETRTGPRAS